MSAKSSKEPKRDGKASANEPASEKRLPFEPAQNRKKPPKKAASTVTINAKDDSSDAKSVARKAAAIPEVISRRMARRMAFFCGIPTSLGMLTLVISYIVISQHWYKLPHVAVLLINMGFFGLGVLGLSYGALSASWDEDRLGSWFGWQEFRTNFARLTTSWRSTKEKPDS
ncbi:PAM68 family protein [Leptothermofonsia sp. ETS-13]|uniref:PAM68 family protein n=1 Tax=Leptothermofonsia sp. ETS-13 TaxID=3035696 RepID=UPI003B9EE523